MISQAYAMAPPPSGGGGAQPGIFQSMVIPMAVMFAIIYFIALRPQKKKEQEHRKFLDSLQKGDEVITQSGIYGKVAGVAEQVITLQVADNVKIRVTKGSIAGKQAGTGALAEVKNG